MKLRKKTILVLIGGAGILFFALVMLAFLATRFIGAEAVKEKIETTLSRKTGGAVAIGRAEFFLFPRPGVDFQRAWISIPEKVQGRVERVTIYPEIGALLLGKLRIAELTLDAPDVTVTLPKEEPEPLTLSAIERRVSTLLSALEATAPNLSLEAKKGRVELLKGDKALFFFRDIETRILSSPGLVKVSLSCSSNLWDRIAFDGRIEPKGLKTVGQIEITGARPHIVSEQLFPEALLSFGESMANITVRFQANGVSEAKAEVRGSIPHLTVRRGKGLQILKAGSLEATLHLDEEKTELSLEELQLEHPKLRLSGKLTLDRKTPWAALELEGQQVDAVSLREAALSLAGDVPLVRTIFDYVRGGTVPLITFRTDGKSMGDLGATENILLKGQIQGGEIFIPGPSLDLKDVNGDALISRGILRGERLGARLGKAAGHEGVLSVGLKGADAPFHLDVLVDADLSELPGILRPLVRDKVFREELSLVSDISGEAKGRLVLGESLQAIKVRTEVRDLRLSGRYERIPYPVEVREGRFSFDETGGIIGVGNLKGMIGTSSFSDLSARLDIRDEPYLTSLSASSSVSLDEIHRWLASSPGIGEALKEVKSLRGRIELTESSLKGPLYEPAKWDFKATGEFRGISLETTLLKGPIEVATGRFSATPEKISMADVQTGFLDASLNASGSVEGYRTKTRKAEVTMRGSLGPEAVGRVAEAVLLPPELNVRTPLTLSEGHLVWEEGLRTSFEGKISIQDGPVIALVVVVSPGGLAIPRLVVDDTESHAALAVDLKEKLLGLRFAGNLTKHTLEKTFTSNVVSGEWVGDDFQAEVDLEHPGLSTARGRLEVRHFNLPWKAAESVNIENLALDAEGRDLRVKSAVLGWNGHRVELSGNARFSGEGVALDLDAFADQIDLNAVKKALGQEGGETSLAPASRLPVSGTIRVKSGNLVYKQFTWMPFESDVSLAGDRITVAVNKAALCGISTTGKLILSGRDITLDLSLASMNQDLQETIVCLTNKERDITGKFELTAQVKAEGNPESLLRSLQGSVMVRASNGQVLRSPGIAKIFALLNPTEIFRGRLPDLKAQGLAYRSISAEGKIQGGELTLTRAVLDGENVNMFAEGTVDLPDGTLNLAVLVSPFKAVDFVVRRIPLLGGILQGQLVAVPVGVSGTISEPSVTVLSPSAIGSGLLGVMKRTLQVPLKIISPVTGVPSNP